jgi:hypothetical protein
MHEIAWRSSCSDARDRRGSPRVQRCDDGVQAARLSGERR